jgi:outer membrane lipoprotein-sorting protein
MLLALLGAAPFAASASPVPSEGFNLTRDETAAISRINSYLNSFKHLQGHFVQIAPDGSVVEGQFYLRRPGRIRFEYDKPSPVLVVADGFWLGVTNKKLKTTDRFPLRSTPYWPLLEEKVDLMAKARITSVVLEPDLTTVTIEDPKGKSTGQLTLVFEGESPSLKQWIVKAEQGLITTVSLSDLIANKPARNNYFVIKDIGKKNEFDNDRN